MKENVRQLIDLIDYVAKNKQISAVLVFLDAEKAFERMNWNFLTKTLEKMDMGSRFRQAIGVIY